MCELLDVLPFSEDQVHVKAYVKPHVKCMKICVNLNEDCHVKACVKPHVKCM